MKPSICWLDMYLHSCQCVLWHSDMTRAFYSLAVKCTNCGVSSTSSIIGPHKRLKFTFVVTDGALESLLIIKACSNSRHVIRVGEQLIQPSKDLAFRRRIGFLALMRENIRPYLTVVFRWSWPKIHRRSTYASSRSVGSTLSSSSISLTSVSSNTLSKTRRAYRNIPE
jgi:hypothetical protein